MDHEPTPAPDHEEPHEDDFADVVTAEGDPPIDEYRLSSRTPST